MQSTNQNQQDKKKRGTQVLAAGAWPNPQYYQLVEAMKDFPTGSNQEKEEKKDDEACKSPIDNKFKE